jgi:putative redox protein
MANIKPKTVVTQKMSATSTSHSRTDVAVRDLNVVIDEPEARGGTNQGASPTETLGVALAGCINVISHKVAESLDVDLGEMTIDVATQFDRRGVMLEEEIDLPFPQMDVEVTVKTNASEEDIARVKQGLAKYCPLSKAIKASGTVLNENWTIERP